MNVLAINCTNCGAPLEFAARSKQVTCKYCSSLLIILRGPGDTFQVSVAKKGVAATDIVTTDANATELRDELRRLDRAWQADREALLRSLNRQKFHVIDQQDVVMITVTLVAAVVMCVIATVVVGVSGLVFMSLCGVLPVAWFITCGGLGVADSAEYLGKRREYESRRGALVMQLRGCFKSHGVDSEEVDLLPAGAKE